MIEPTLWDHLLAAVLLIAFPLHARWSWARFRRAVATGGPGARRREYVRGMARQWTVTGIVLLGWFLAGRSPASLGFQLPLDAGSLAGLAITGLGLAFLAGQWRAVRRLERSELVEYAGETLGVAELLPRTDEEARAFAALSLTAGICEEILYRGFLIAWVGVWTGPWTSALLAGLAFGVAHAYQGRSGVIKTGVIGILAGFLYVGTASLLWPMILHAAIDVHGGAVGRRILDAVAARHAERSHPDSEEGADPS